MNQDNLLLDRHTNSLCIVHIAECMTCLLKILHLGWGYSFVTQHLPSMFKALGSRPSTAKKIRLKQNRIKGFNYILLPEIVINFMMRFKIWPLPTSPDLSLFIIYKITKIFLTVEHILFSLIFNTTLATLPKPNSHVLDNFRTRDLLENVGEKFFMSSGLQQYVFFHLKRPRNFFVLVCT